jgi:hypothetical protein
MTLPRLRITVRRMMVAVAVVAALVGVYLHVLRVGLRPEIGFVGTDGAHGSRYTTDKEAAELKKSLATYGLKVQE